MTEAGSAGPTSPAGSGPAERSHWVDLVRGFAVLLVVFYHVVIALVIDGTPAPAWARYVASVTGPFRIPTLVFCSGWLLERSLRKSTSVYIRGKLERIGWPYLVWTAVIVLFLAGGSYFFGEGNYGPARLLELVLSPRTYTWYLAYLLLYYLLALVAPPRVRSWLILPLLVASLVIDDGDGWTRLLFLLAFFFLGDFASRHRGRVEFLCRRPIVVALGLFAALSTGVAGSVIPGLRYDIWAAIGVAGTVVLGVRFGNRIATTRVGIGLSAIGRDSIVYYTTHWVVVTAGVQVAVTFGSIEANLLIALLLGLGLGVSWVMVRLSRRSRVVAALYAWPSSRRR